MEKTKRYGIFHIKDSDKCIASITAESFVVLAGTAVVAFKDEYGVTVLVHHLEQGYFINVV